MNTDIKKYPSLTSERWKKHINGFNIVDCCVLDSSQLVLIGKENIPDDEYDVLVEGKLQTRMVKILLSHSEIKIASAQLGGFRFPKVAIERQSSPVILISSRQSEGVIYHVNTDSTNGLEYITPDGEKNPKKSSYPLKLKTIDGVVYAASFGRMIHKRTSAGHWEPMTEGLLWPEHMDSTDMGFNDIHGPNEQHLYAVGGCGDVWHYDGKKWQWCDFPTNEQLSAVVVAPNGDVYISSEGGSLWRGKMHTWERIYTGGSSVLNKDLIWFNDQLWVSSDYQVRIWNGKILERPLYDGKEMILAGNMDAYENLLLVADINTVNIFDGKDWHNIVTPY